MADIDARTIQGEVQKLGFSLDSSQAEPLAAFLGLLERWNRRTNLVGKNGWRAVLRHLAVDSLHLGQFLPALPLPESPLSLDLGAGAGLPGLPLRCVWQKGDYWLVEVREKRAGFMRSALARMKVPGTHVFEGRAEDALAEIAPDRPADLILSRAFMPWRDLLDFISPMLAPKGIIVILANEPLPDALPQGWQAVHSLAYQVDGGTRHFWALSR